MKKGLISFLSLGILVLSFASGYLINDVAKRQKTKYPDSFLRLYEVYNIIQNVSFEDIDEQLLCQGAISGMASALNDPNTFIQGNPLFEANPGGAPCNVLAMLQHFVRDVILFFFGP